MWPDVFDQAVFGQQGFPFALAEQGIETVDGVQHLGFLWTQVGALDEIRGDPVAELVGFSDVQDDALGVLHEVHPRRRREVSCVAEQAGKSGLARFCAPWRGGIRRQEAVFVFKGCVWVVRHG